MTNEWDDSIESIFNEILHRQNRVGMCNNVRDNIAHNIDIKIFMYLESVEVDQPYADILDEFIYWENIDINRNVI